MSATIITDQELDEFLADSNKTGMVAALEAKAVSNSLGDKIRSAPRKARAWLMETAKAAHLDTAFGYVAEVAGKARSVLARLLGPIRNIGIVNIFGALATCTEGRRLLATGFEKAYNVVTWPVRMVGRALGWVARKLGMAKVADKVESTYYDLEFKLFDRFGRVLDWMDEREHAGAMRWGRSYYQGAVAYRMIRRYAPAGLRTPLYIASLFVPNFGVGDKPEGAESKMSLVPDAAAAAEKAVDEAAGDAPEPATPTVVEPPAKPVYETLEGVIVGSGRKVTLQRATEADGSVWYRYNGRRYEPGKLPGNIKVGDPVTAEATPERAPSRPARRVLGDRAPAAAAQ